MSFALRDLVVSRVFASPSVKAVMICLSDYHQVQGAWPALRTIADDTGFDERTVRRQLRELEADGLIVMVGEADPSRSWPRRYQIHADRIKDLPMTRAARIRRERQLRKETATGSQGGGHSDPPYRGTD